MFALQLVRPRPHPRPRTVIANPADASPANLGPADASPANLGPADVSLLDHILAGPVPDSDLRGLSLYRVGWQVTTINGETILRLVSSSMQ